MLLPAAGRVNAALTFVPADGHAMRRAGVTAAGLACCGRIASYLLCNWLLNSSCVERHTVENGRRIGVGVLTCEGEIDVATK